MSRSIAAGAALVLALLLVGCGGDEGDDLPTGEELTAAFVENAAQVYEDEGLDREQDFARGLDSVEDCFYLDDEAAAAIAEEAVGTGEVQVNDLNFLNGTPGEEERMGCSIGDAASGTETTVVLLNVGTTQLDPDQFLEGLLSEPESVELEGEADGLDPAEVVAAEREGSNIFAWVHEDFVISISNVATELSVEDGYAALPVAVDEITRTLTG